MAETDPVPQPFWDWYGIWPGQTGIDERGQAWVQDMPVGVRLVVQPARKSEIFIVPERPWEQGTLSPTCILWEEGLLRLWYFSQGADEGDATFVAYAESRDGFDWKRPELGLQEYRGSAANNLLFRVDAFELQSVFIDPSESPEARFKALGRGSICFHKGVVDPHMTYEKKWEVRRAMAAAGYTREQMAKALYFHNHLRGAVSPDGVRWTFLKAPLLDVGTSGLDSQNIAAYDPEAQRYVGYLRGHQDRRRVVRRTEGEAFGGWGSPHVVFGMDPQDPVEDDVYTSAYCRCPGGSGRHLMFPAIYHRWTSNVDVQVATSRDGLLWSRPGRQPILTRQNEGGDYGMVYAFPNLVSLSADEWGLMFIGQFDLHDWGDRCKPDRPPEWRWARWKRDRLVALEAPVEGRVTLVERECLGKALRINFQTQREGGWIKVEIVHPPASPASPVRAIEGYGLEEADVLAGDEVSGVVTWKGRSDLSALEGKAVSVRLHLARAKVFSVAV